MLILRDDRARGCWIEVQVTRRHVVDLLRAAELTQVADEVARSWPDTIDFDRATALLQEHGITKDFLVSRMGGSP